LEQTEARQLVRDLARVAVETVATRSLLQDALTVALTTGITVYDAMYVTLAVRLDTAVITGDDRLVDKIAAHPLLVPHVRRLQDFVD
jgi:predicted nucleic acid-binding protein